MDWYLMVLNKYADFDGRARRSEYWMFTLINTLIIIALAIVGGIGFALIENGTGGGGLLFVPIVLYILALFVPSLAVLVRRFHDIGKSGWMVLLFMVLGIIPIVGLIASIVQIVMLCQDSDQGINEYGPSPKYPELVGVMAGNVGFASMGLNAQSPGFTSADNLGFCKNCGTKFQDASPFCNNCGVHR
ncbi:MAG: DUF805 domain-containing protein [Terracidiphilus sp.]